MTKTDTYTLTDTNAAAVHSVISDHLQALKNWTVSAVERGDFERAQQLAKEVRQFADLYATFNVKVRRDLEARS